MEVLLCQVEAGAGAAGAVPVGMSAEVVSRLQDRATALTQERKRRGRTVPEGLVTPDQIRSFLTLASHPVCSNITYIIFLGLLLSIS